MIEKAGEGIQTPTAIGPLLALGLKVDADPNWVPIISDHTSIRRVGKGAYGEVWLAVNTILDESTVRVIIPRLKEAGAQGIVEYPLNKIVM